MDQGIWDHALQVVARLSREGGPRLRGGSKRKSKRKSAAGIDTPHRPTTSGEGARSRSDRREGSDIPEAPLAHESEEEAEERAREPTLEERRAMRRRAGIMDDLILGPNKNMWVDAGIPNKEVKRRLEFEEDEPRGGCYWERQVRALCGLHAVNGLLQRQLYSEADLRQIAASLDNAEAALGGTAGLRPNALHGGDFTYQTVQVALERESLYLSPARAESIQALLRTAGGGGAARARGANSGTPQGSAAALDFSCVDWPINK